MTPLLQKAQAHARSDVRHADNRNPLYLSIQPMRWTGAITMARPSIFPGSNDGFVHGGCETVRGSSPRPLQIELRVVADADAVIDGPRETRGKDDVRPGELIPHQVFAPIRERRLDVTHLLAEIFGGFCDDDRRRAVDVRQTVVCAMPPHHVEARRIQFRDDEETPFQPPCLQRLVLRDEAVLLRYRRNAITRYGNRIAILSELTEPRTLGACGGATGHATPNGQTRVDGEIRNVSSNASNRQFAYQAAPD
jgi:hypothetical protein